MNYSRTKLLDRITTVSLSVIYLLVLGSVMQAQQLSPVSPALVPVPGERSRSEEGYLYRHSHTYGGPEGIPRQHERGVREDNPYDRIQPREATSQDGQSRFRSQTRSQNAIAGGAGQTTTDPYRQTHRFQHAWQQDGQAPAGTSSTMHGPAHAGAAIPRSFSPGNRAQPSPPNNDPPKKWGWLTKLNPFRNHRSGFRGSESLPAGRSGFTVGSSGRNRTSWATSGLSGRQPGHPSLNARRLGPASLRGSAQTHGGAAAHQSGRGH